MVLLASLAALLMGMPISDFHEQELTSPVYAVHEKARNALRTAFPYEFPATHTSHQRHSGRYGQEG